MSIVGNRLNALRKKSGKSVIEIAKVAGFSTDEYYDLESNDDLFMTVSLAEIVKLARVLGITPVGLFSEEDSSISQITFKELSKNIREFIDREKTDVSAFEKRCGWEISSFLLDSKNAYDWSIDCLRDICREPGINWMSALPKMGNSRGK